MGLFAKYGYCSRLSNRLEVFTIESPPYHMMGLDVSLWAIALKMGYIITSSYSICVCSMHTVSNGTARVFDRNGDSAPVPTPPTFGMHWFSDVH